VDDATSGGDFPMNGEVKVGLWRYTQVIYAYQLFEDFFLP
jgi:hypothetical protein